jgi:hypothetical protein
VSQSVLCPVLIGRAGELALLEEQLRQATKGTGRVLDACYFERRGSHERVAESLHMTMPTYYRRLRGGHPRLAKLLREREAAAAASPV